MYGEVKIGEKKVKLLANAATPFWYNQIFHADYFRETRDFEDEAMAANVFTRLTFVMTKQAGKSDMKKVNEGQFMDWLEGFEPLDVQLALPEIINLYTGQTEGTAEAKK